MRGAASAGCGRAERLLDLGRSLEHERHELPPSRGPETGARPAEADARDEIAPAVANGAERDMRPSSSSSTISAQPRRRTRRSSAASPERVVTVLAVSRAGWASSNHASSSLGLSSARTSFPADDACSGTSAPTQPTTPRRCAPSSWVTISIAGAPRDDGKERRLVSTIAEPAQAACPQPRSARCGDRRSARAETARCRSPTQQASRRRALGRRTSEACG